MSGKYLVGNINDGFFSGPAAILFPDYIGHNKISANIFNNEVTSGGFYCVDEKGNVVIWGESVSCKVKSLPEDKRLIEKTLGINIDL